MNRFYLLILLAAVLLAACAGPQAATPARPGLTPAPAPLPASEVHLTDTTPYGSGPDLNPKEARYFPLLNQTLNLTPDEMALLAQNGFVVSDRVAWPQFSHAYAWIYWKDLPVIITSDSLLHAVHQSYLNVLRQLEYDLLIPELRAFLTQTRTALRSMPPYTDAALETQRQDLLLYLDVAANLLSGGQEDEQGEALAARARQAEAYQEVTLFGVKRMVDFTLFKPRGHYTESDELSHYFQAMTWLAQLDFRLVTYDALTSQPKVHPQALAAAQILLTAIDDVGAQTHLDTIDGILQLLVGQSDNITTPQLRRLVADLELSAPRQALNLAPERLLQQLAAQDYGNQRITGQIITRHTFNDSDAPIPRPASYALMGQRFALDSFVLGNVVYDRMMDEEKQPIERPLPSPLDVAYALGQNRASTHLADELAIYPYAGYLAAQREVVQSLPPDFWDAPLYNQWLRLIRALNNPAAVGQAPAAMHTAAWADKTLQTQLASWAQLRHDNILYVKQSMTTAQITCSFPAAYVEPVPEFYRALYALGDNSYNTLSRIEISQWPQSKKSLLAYFDRVRSIAAQLEAIAEAELAGTPLSPEQEHFLRNVIKHRPVSVLGCGGPTFEEQWDGWYMQLIYGEDDNPALIADVHSNPQIDPQSSLYPPRVLHAATGYPSLLLMLVEGPEGSTLFAGPSFSYYELVTTGDVQKAPQRLDDQEWRDLLQRPSAPAAPAWTASFRVQRSTSLDFRFLPDAQQLQENCPLE